MKLYDVKCPICGKLNRGLYLDETDGWMECECCGQLTKHLPHEEKKLVPVFVIRNLTGPTPHPNPGAIQEGSKVSVV